MLEDWQIKEKIGKHKAICECKQCGNEFHTHFYDARKSKMGHICKDCKSLISSLKTFNQSDLIKLFDYDPLTGIVSHKTDSLSGAKGETVGYPHNEGYISVSIGGKEYLLHRVIWFMQTGLWPEEVDHIDHNRSNNIWDNLREVIKTDNQKNTSLSKNNSSGVNGVRQLPSGRYSAFIMVNRKQISLGTRDTLDEAAALRKAADAHYGFHANHGS